MPRNAHSVLALAALALAFPHAQAEVLRCADATGHVVYTDQSCPPGTRSVRQVPVPETPAPGAAAAPPDEAAAPSPALPPAAPPAAPPAPQPQAAQQQPAGGGLTVIGPEPRPTPEAQRWSVQSEDRLWLDPWQGYPGGYWPGAGRHPHARPPLDQRPRMRHCDAQGCTDGFGNHYDRQGRLDRYPGPGGKTCRPVGTTVICR